MNIENVISVSEFRANTKLFLDTASVNPVYIRRGDQVFQLSLSGGTVVIPHENETEANIPAAQEIADEMIRGAAMAREKIAFEASPLIDEVAEWCVDHDCNPEQCKPAHAAEALEKPCCSKKNPCQHWQWSDPENTSEAGWVNVLSGRTREVEA
jgi:hypothetical protein